ncbi:MAG: hypothetical protein HON06_09995, partial [Candidatus Puniceispirillum sp.]|nr:hypothetical protein [Candidatus Puniceispirillum sp.]
IMPSGILTAIGYVTGLEAYVIGVMQQGIEVLIGLAGFISSLPLAGWRISPPGNVVLAVLSSGCLVLIGCHRRVYPLGVLLICFIRSYVVANGYTTWRFICQRTDALFDFGRTGWHCL